MQCSINNTRTIKTPPKRTNKNDENKTATRPKTDSHSDHKNQKTNIQFFMTARMTKMTTTLSKISTPPLTETKQKHSSQLSYIMSLEVLRARRKDLFSGCLFIDCM